MSSLSRLIAAATLISSTLLAPGLAAADDRREGREDRHEEERLAGQYDRNEQLGRHAPAPAHVHGRDCGHDALPAAPPAGWSWRDDRRWDGRGWVRAGWERRQHDARFARAQAIRLELAALERDRAEFHARFAWRPGKLARYDARYLERRAGLEDELQRLTWYAWR